MNPIYHRTEGLARSCNAHDLILITGGLQCANCLAHNAPFEPHLQCTAVCSNDVRCPIRIKGDGDLCWIHKAQVAHV